MTDNAKLREIRAKLDAIAPLPEDGPVTARTLARYFAVRAQERFTKMSHPALDSDPKEISAMSAEFAAAHALYALAEADGNILPDDEAGSAFTAAQIQDATNDGGATGEWLFEHLGAQTSNEVAMLAGQLAALIAADPAQKTPRQSARDPFFVPVVPDKEFPATWAGGHALVIQFGDEELGATCQCGEPLGWGTPATSLNEFSARWERHVLTGVPL